MDIHKILPVNARWDETVWKGPMDFIAAQAGGRDASQPARVPHDAETETPDGKQRQRRKHAKKVDEVGGAVMGLSFVSHVPS